MPYFRDRPEELHVEYVRLIRNFDSAFPAATTLFNAYRKRAVDEERNIMIPHSFTFTRRECAWPQVIPADIVVQCAGIIDLFEIDGPSTRGELVWSGGKAFIVEFAVTVMVLISFS